MLLAGLDFFNREANFPLLEIKSVVCEMSMNIFNLTFMLGCHCSYLDFALICRTPLIAGNKPTISSDFGNLVKAKFYTTKDHLATGYGIIKFYQVALCCKALGPLQTKVTLRFLSCKKFQYQLLICSKKLCIY